MQRVGDLDGFGVQAELASRFLLFDSTLWMITPPAGNLHSLLGACAVKRMNLPSDRPDQKGCALARLPNVLSELARVVEERFDTQRRDRLFDELHLI
jgi:hypothetical protein